MSIGRSICAGSVKENYDIGKTISPGDCNTLSIAEGRGEERFTDGLGSLLVGSGLIHHYINEECVEGDGRGRG